MPITVKDRNNKWDLYGLMFTPTTLDKKKKYPIINYIYPGPQGGGVGNRSFAASRSDHQALAELGFIVVIIDGSCNPDRSKSFHDACYGNMADNTLEDQIAGIKQLAAKYPYLGSKPRRRLGTFRRRICDGGGDVSLSRFFQSRHFRIRQSRQPQLRRRLGRTLHRSAVGRQLRKTGESALREKSERQSCCSHTARWTITCRRKTLIWSLTR